MVMAYTEKGRDLLVTLEKESVEGNEKEREKVEIEGEPVYLLSELSGLQHLNIKNYEPS